MTIDWTITLGSLVNLVSLVATIGLVGLAIVTRIARLETKVDAMWNWFVEQVKDINGRPVKK